MYTRTLLIALALFASLPAQAEETAASLRPDSAAPASVIVEAPAPAHLPDFLVSARMGMLFGQPFSRLGTSVIPELAFEWHPDVWKRHLGLMFAVSYTQPETARTYTDPRLTQNSGLTSYSHTVRDLGLTLAPTLWFPMGKMVIPYASAGLKVHFYRNDVQGSAGDSSPFGENQEPKRRAGFVGRLGAGFRMGPGALTGDVTIDAAPVYEVTTGDANAGDLIVSLGYSLFI
jgi:hypothetical protein